MPREGRGRRVCPSVSLGRPPPPGEVWPPHNPVTWRRGSTAWRRASQADQPVAAMEAELGAPTARVEEAAAAIDTPGTYTVPVHPFGRGRPYKNVSPVSLMGGYVPAPLHHPRILPPAGKPRGAYAAMLPFSPLPPACSARRGTLWGSAQGPAGRPPPAPQEAPSRRGHVSPPPRRSVWVRGQRPARRGAASPEPKRALPVENILPRGPAREWAAPLPPAPRRPARTGLPRPLSRSPRPHRAGPRGEGPFPPPPHLARPRCPHRRRRGGCRACWAGREGTGATYRSCPLPRWLRLLGRPRFRPPPRGSGPARRSSHRRGRAGGGAGRSRRDGAGEKKPGPELMAGARRVWAPRPAGRWGGSGVPAAPLGVPGVARQRPAGRGVRQGRANGLPRPPASGQAGTEKTQSVFLEGLYTHTEKAWKGG